MKESIQQYLVVPKSRAVKESHLLTEIIGLLEAMPDVSVERVVGPENSPERIVIKCIAAPVQKLLAQYGDRLIIELDSPLELF